MRMSVRTCLILISALQLWTAGTYAAEAVPETPAAAAAPPAAAAPAAAETPVAAPADSAAATGTARRKVVVLPVEFVAHQMSAGGVVEPVPAWTEKSQQNITHTVDGIIGADARFERVPLPELEPAQQARLREHIELFKVVAVDVNTVLTTGGKAWADKKTNFDYTLGDGLMFLRERTGADVALIVAGGQTTQSGGNVFMQLMIAGLTGVAVGGGGSFLVCGVVNLSDGRIEWFNSLLGAELFGMKSVDMRSPESAQKTLTNLFAPYPSSPLVGRRIF
jgi:hypothetical protein